MATMDPGQRGFGQQYNIPDLPFSTPGNMDRFFPSSHRGRGPGGMRRQGPVDRFDESIGERSRGGQIPPELLEMLMAMLMAVRVAAGAVSVHRWVAAGHRWVEDGHRWVP